VLHLLRMKAEPVRFRVGALMGVTNVGLHAHLGSNPSAQPRLRMAELEQALIYEMNKTHTNPRTQLSSNFWKYLTHLRCSKHMIILETSKTILSSSEDMLHLSFKNDGTLVAVDATTTEGLDDIAKTMGRPHAEVWACIRQYHPDWDLCSQP
jgi:hypothetical protein